MLKLFKKRQSVHKVEGFTLVELIVASAIFASILVIAVGSLFTAESINTRLQETQVILDSVNLSSEVITRDLRYGGEFHCDTVAPNGDMPINSQYIAGQATAGGYFTLRSSCTKQIGGGSVIIFKPIAPLTGTTNSSLDRIVYKRATSTLPTGKVVGSIIRQEFPYGAPKKEYQITASDVDVTSFKLYAQGIESSDPIFNTSAVSDTNQPLLTLSISGVTIPTDPKTVPVRFEIETSVSPRGLDN